MIKIFYQQPIRIERIPVFNSVWKSDNNEVVKPIDSDTSDTISKPLCMVHKEEDNNHVHIYKGLEHLSDLSEKPNIPTIAPSITKEFIEAVNRNLIPLVEGMCQRCGYKQEFKYQVNCPICLNVNDFN